MIITLTANPSVDRTASLAGSLERGGVNRLSGIRDVAGGKGINVAHVIHRARADFAPPATEAVFPAAESDPFVGMVAAAGLPYRAVPAGAAVRVNLTVTERDGTTTKLNAPGAELSPAVREELTSLLVEEARRAGPEAWIALCGSLPAGCPASFYLDLIAALGAQRPHIALDTSDAPLQSYAAVLRDDPDRGRELAPDLIKPNGFELGQLVGCDGRELEERAAAGDFLPAARAAQRVHDHGVGAVLVTLGAAGAVLTTDGRSWSAPSPEISVASTVGAGDSALAGYLLAAHQGLDPADRLRWAVIHGSVAASLPGTGLPEGIAPEDYPEVPVTPLVTD